SSDNLYNVVLTGQFISGFDQGRAIKSLAQLLNASVVQAQGLLKGSSKVIKKKVNRDQALKYKLLLASHGIVAKVTNASEPSDKALKKALLAKPKTAAAISSAANVTHISEAVKRKVGSEARQETANQNKKSSSVKRTAAPPKAATPAKTAA